MTPLLRKTITEYRIQNLDSPAPRLRPPADLTALSRGPKSWSLDYQGDFKATRSVRNPTTILQSDLLGFATADATPITKMEFLVTGPRH